MLDTLTRSHTLCTLHAGKLDIYLRHISTQFLFTMQVLQVSYPDTGNLYLLGNTVCLNHYENFKSQSDIFPTRISCRWFPSVPVHCSLAQSQQSDRFIVCLLLYFSGRGGEGRGGRGCSVVMQTPGPEHDTAVRQLS